MVLDRERGLRRRADAALPCLASMLRVENPALDRVCVPDAARAQGSCALAVRGRYGNDLGGQKLMTSVGFT